MDNVKLLRVFKSRVMRRIFGLRREEVREEWKKSKIKIFMIYTSQ
jgi:hypothetical protein